MLRWHKGMTLGEFEAMIEAHRREEGEHVAGADNDACLHPFERIVTTIRAQRIEEGLRIIVDYSCGECEEFLGHERKRVRL